MSGSVRPKQPSASPEQSRGSHSFFCSSVPQRTIDEHTSEVTTETTVRMAESPRPDLLHDQAVGAVVHAAAAVLLGHDRAEEADVGDLLHELGVEVLVAVVVAGARDDLVVGEVARGLADQALLVGQLEVDQGSPGWSWLHRADCRGSRVRASALSISCRRGMCSVDVSSSRWASRPPAAWPSAPSSGARPWPRPSGPAPGPYGPLRSSGRERPEAARRASARGSWLEPSCRCRGTDLRLARLPGRPGHLPHARRRLDPRVELRGARAIGGGAGAIRFDCNGRIRVRVPDPRRHGHQLLGRRHAVGHLALVRGGGTRAGVGVRPAGRPGARWLARPWACSSTRRPRWTRAGSACTSPRTSATAASTASRPALAETSRHGQLEIAAVATERLRHAGTRCRTRRRRPPPRASRCRRSTRFARGEGIWFDSGIVYVATTADNKVHAYDTRRRRIEVIYDARQAHRPAAHRRRQHHGVPLGRPLRVRGQRHRRARHRPDHPGPADRPLPHRHRHPSTRIGAHRAWCSTRAGAGIYFSSQRFDGPEPSSRSAGPFRTPPAADRAARDGRA